jgi:antirestriction protein ArdC
MTVKRKTKKTTDERKPAVLALRERLAAYKDGLNDQRIAQITARFDGYSENNALLIAMQRPTATDVSGFWTWKGRGRQVRKGEKGIKIFAPMNLKGEVVDADTEEEKQYLVFTTKTVFDIDQTDPIQKEA